MDATLLTALEDKIKNIGYGDIYKRNIGQFVIWFSPLTYTDQLYVQESLDNHEGGVNAILDAKLKTLSRSIVGIDDIDLRPYKNKSQVFEISDPTPGNRKNKIKVDLAKYLEYKVSTWGQEFVDLAYDVFYDITVTVKNKFRETVVLENTQDPRVELAELEIKVHELRARLGLPVLEERLGSSYKNLQGEPDVEDLPDGPVPDLVSKTYQAQENPETEPEPDDEPEENYPTESEEEPEPDLDDILSSVTPPITEPEPEPVPVPEPIRTVPVATPDQPKAGPPSPIHQALSARRNAAKPVRQVPPSAESSPDKPFSMASSARNDEVIENRMAQPVTKRPSIDPSASRQSVNPRFKSHR